MQANSGMGLPSFSYLKLDGGVLQSDGSSAVNFTRILSATPGSNAFEWTANGGGFAAGSAPMTVRIGNGTNTVNWGSAGGANIAGILKLSSTTAANVVDFQNGINLGGQIRTIQVDDNPNSAADAAKISGLISDGSGSGGIVKIGAGTLTLTGPLTYTGNTAIDGGRLQIDSPTATLATFTGSGTLGIGTGTTLTAASIWVGTLDIGTTPGTAAVPEPSTYILLIGAAFAALLLRKRRR